jgi:hypothetical protein
MFNIKCCSKKHLTLNTSRAININWVTVTIFSNIMYPINRSKRNYQVLTTAFQVLGGIVVSVVIFAIVFRFSGTIDLKVGSDGGHLIIQGNPPAEVVVNSR